MSEKNRPELADSSQYIPLRERLLRNKGTKLLALLLSITLWYVVLTNDTNLTRDRTLTNLYVTVTNQSTLDNRKLAITDDLAQLLPQVRLTVDVNQADYYRVTSNNVRVELDLSRIHETGEQTLPLTASSVYGTIDSIYPDSVTLNVDEQDTRDVPVLVELSGQSDAVWYTSPVSTPPFITLTGPKSQLEQISAARAVMELSASNSTGALTRAVAYTLINSEQEAVAFSTVKRSSSSIIASVTAYPTRLVPVDTEISRVLTGSVAPGYKVDRVEASPSEILLAASERYLDGVTSLKPVSVNVSGLSETTTLQTRIINLSDMKELATNEVLLTVYISPVDIQEE